MAATVRDQLAEPGAAQALRLAVRAGRLRIGQGGQQLEPATATIGVEPLRYVGHGPSVPSGPGFVKAKCAAQLKTHRWSTTHGAELDNHHSGQSLVEIQRAVTKPAAVASPTPATRATPVAAPRSPSRASTTATTQAEIAAVSVHQA